MTLNLADEERIIQKAENKNLIVQIGFNRRFEKGFMISYNKIKNKKIGNVIQLRSVTRDPGPFQADPTKIPLWTIFYETLIPDSSYNIDVDVFISPAKSIPSLPNISLRIS